MRCNKIRIIGTISICLGLISIISSAGFWAYNAREDARAAENATRTANILFDIINSGEQKGVFIREGENGARTEDDGSQNGESAQTGVLINGETFIAVLSVPSLGLELPVNKEWSYPKLKESPCRYAGSIGDSLVIAAHNYKNHFGSIEKLKKGERAVLTDLSGYKYYYELTEIKTLEAESIDEMVSDEFDLTLFTCTYGGYARVTARFMEILGD